MSERRGELPSGLESSAMYTLPTAHPSHRQDTAQPVASFTTHLHWPWFKNSNEIHHAGAHPHLGQKNFWRGVVGFFPIFRILAWFSANHHIRRYSYLDNNPPSVNRLFDLILILIFIRKKKGNINWFWIQWRTIKKRHKRKIYVHVWVFYRLTDILQSSKFYNSTLDASPRCPKYEIARISSKHNMATQPTTHKTWTYIIFPNIILGEKVLLCCGPTYLPLHTPAACCYPCASRRRTYAC